MVEFERPFSIDAKRQVQADACEKQARENKGPNDLLDMNPAPVVPSGAFLKVPHLQREREA